MENYDSRITSYDSKVKSYDSRTYGIHDFLEWDQNDQLELLPRFQRRSVWSDNARSYLMDTIIRGKPIPKIFIRQNLNPQTRMQIREVVDGQQRLRTILSYLKDGFKISKKHNNEYGGLYFSQLDEDTQVNILGYEISVDLLQNMADTEILDIFARLNSYAVTLNPQEKIHASHFGVFKMLAEQIARDFNYFWEDNKILTPRKILRMEDDKLCSDLLIAMIEGIRSSKQIGKFYKEYEERFDHDADELRSRFERIINVISGIFRGSLSGREFRRTHVFYSLFVSIYHLLYGVENIKRPRFEIDEKMYPRLSARLERVDRMLDPKSEESFNQESEITFLKDCRKATTDTAVRVRRSEFLIDVMSGKIGE